MYYETEKRNHGLKYDPFKALIVPRPIGWVTTLSENGEVNLAPYSFFNGVSDNPPMVIFSSAGVKDSLKNILETKECTCSMATKAISEQMNVSSAPFNHGVNEYGPAGLTMAPSEAVKPPRVAESPAAFECKLWQTVELPAPAKGAEHRYTVIFATVIGVYINDEYIKDGIVDTGAMHPISRLGYMDYGELTPDRIFSLNRPRVDDSGNNLVENTPEWDGVYR